jgi:hypothetical protein
VKVRIDTDTSAIASLYTALTSVASGDTGREIAREAAAGIQAKIDEGFARSRDPYGVKWRKPQAGNKAGTRTGKLRSSVRAVPLGPRIQLRAQGVEYAGYFHGGTSKMVARPVFPDSRGVPDEWKREINNAARRVVARKLRRQGR